MASELGIIQRDLLRLLDYMDSDAVESETGTVQIVTLSCAIASIAFVQGLDKAKVRALVDDMIAGFDPDRAETARKMATVAIAAGEIEIDARKVKAARCSRCGSVVTSVPASVRPVICFQCDNAPNGH